MLGIQRRKLRISDAVKRGWSTLRIREIASALPYSPTSPAVDDPKNVESLNDECFVMILKLLLQSLRT